MKKITFFIPTLFIFLSCVLASPAIAATNTTTPAVDGRCFTRGQCQQVRIDEFGVSTEEADKGFYQGTDSKEACGNDKDESGNDVGFCSAAGTTNTEIKFGTTSSFKNIGEFIQIIYKYVVWAAGILAVVVIMIAGFQWLTSGGNAETITGARKKIGNALMGLFLAVCSYLLLSQISPYLVNLRLPQVWMVNPQPIVAMSVGAFCLTEGELKQACEKLGKPGEYGCRPFHTEGAGLIFSDMFMWGVVLVIDPTGGAVLKGGAKVGEWVLEKAGAVGKKYVSYFFKSPAKKLAEDVATLFGKDSAKVAQMAPQQLEMFVSNEIKKDAGGILLKQFREKVTQTIAVGRSTLSLGLKGGAGAYGAYSAGAFISKKLYNLLKNNEDGDPGICSTSNKLPNGQMCNAEMPADCASGKCVNFDFFGGWIKGLKLGICSDGSVGMPCVTSIDCNGADTKCINDSCTDGSAGSTCESDSDCKNDLKCQQIGSDWTRHECLSEGVGGLGGFCKLASKPGEAGSCDEGLKCIVYDAKATSKGVCTHDETVLSVGDPCWREEDCGASTQFECLGVKVDGDPSKWVAGHCAYKTGGLGSDCNPKATAGQEGKCNEGLNCVSIDGIKGKCSDGKGGSFCGKPGDCVDSGKYVMHCIGTESSIAGVCNYVFYNNDSSVPIDLQGTAVEKKFENDSDAYKCISVDNCTDAVCVKNKCMSKVLKLPQS